jgi:Tfp pilus assembly protein PilF
MTRALWQSALVAVLFAVHPLNVESVAWIASRKNTLSTFFWLLSMMAYTYYAKGPCLKRYLLVVFIFLMGLMAKPMLVTLPFVFLLIDYWPLKRFWGRQLKDNTRLPLNICNHLEFKRFTLFTVIIEKIPLFVLSGLTIYLSSLSVQSHFASVSNIPITLRVGNAIISYIKYLIKMVWPADLVVFYPYPQTVSFLNAIGALLLLITISIVFLKMARIAPYLIVGWLWYLGTLVPALGLVQQGLWPAIADRFAYIPLIGLFIIVIWGVFGLTANLKYRKISFVILIPLCVFILSTVTWKQVGNWKDSISLFGHALKVTSDNYLAHYNLGVAYENQGRMKDAAYHYREALQVKSDYVEAHFALGNVLRKQSRNEEAIQQYLAVLRLRPNFADAHNNLGEVLFSQGLLERAIHHYLRALEIKSGYINAHYNIGIALYHSGRKEDAIGHYMAALRRNPNFAEAHNNLGVVFFSQGNMDQAIRHYLMSLKVRPDYIDAHYNLGIALLQIGDIDGAVAEFRNVLRIDPYNDNVKHALKKTLGLKSEVK